jgi:hypothetical protein
VAGQCEGWAWSLLLSQGGYNAHVDTTAPTTVYVAGLYQVYRLGHMPAWSMLGSVSPAQLEDCIGCYAPMLHMAKALLQDSCKCVRLQAVWRVRHVFQRRYCCARCCCFVTACVGLQGGTYEGEWAGGVMCGTGLRTYSSGRVAAGRFENGQLVAPLELWQCANAAEGAVEAALAARRCVYVWCTGRGLGVL